MGEGLRDVVRKAKAYRLLAQPYCDLPSTRGLATVKASPWHAIQGLAVPNVAGTQSH
jgi:hypothetical protein